MTASVHLLREIREVMTRVKPEDLTNTELAVAIAVFHAAFARIIARQTREAAR